MGFNSGFKGLRRVRSRESKNGAVSHTEHCETDHQQTLGHAPKDMNSQLLHSEEPTPRTFGNSSLKLAPTHIIYVLCTFCLVFLYRGNGSFHSTTGHEDPEGE